MAKENESGVPEILVTEDKQSNEEPVGRPIVIYDEPDESKDSKLETTGNDEPSSTQQSDPSVAEAVVTSGKEGEDQKVEKEDNHAGQVSEHEDQKVEKEDVNASEPHLETEGHAVESKEEKNVEHQSVPDKADEPQIEQNDLNPEKDGEGDTDTTSIKSVPKESNEQSNDEGKQRKQSAEVEVSDNKSLKNDEGNELKETEEERSSHVEQTEGTQSEEERSQKEDDPNKEVHAANDKSKVAEASESADKQVAVDPPQTEDKLHESNNDNEAVSIQHEPYDVTPKRDNKQEEHTKNDSSSGGENEQEVEGGKDSNGQIESTSPLSEKKTEHHSQQEPPMTHDKIAEGTIVPASARQPEMATSSITKLQKIVTNGVTITHQSYNNKEVPLAQEAKELDESATSVRESISLWQKRDKSKSNEEVLKDAMQSGDAEQQAQAATLLAWTKGSKAKKKAPTNTMIVRVKNKMRQAVDFGDRNIVIEEKKSSRFDVTSPPAQPAFQVRKTSVIQPESETNVTTSWIENAIRQYEHENDVELVEMKFESVPKSQNGVYEAFVTAQIGPQGTRKEYHWIIKKAPNTTNQPNNYDKDTYMVTKLGRRMSEFVKAKKLKKPLSIPFRPVIMADSQYAILDDLKDYRKLEDKTGLDLEHVKCVLKGLAKFHALSYVYFNQGNEDVQQFSEDLKMMIDRYYQKSANPTDKQSKRDHLDMEFRRVLSLLRTVDEEGVALANEAEKLFGDDLYNIFQRAHLSSNRFSVLCHGNPVPSNMYFLYNDRQSPVDVKFVGFENAVYGQVGVDLQLFLNTVLGPKIDDQAEFLLRFVYYENLAASLKLLGADRNVLSFDDLFKEFKKLNTYGCLVGCMHLAHQTPSVGSPFVSSNSSNHTNGDGQRGFESKILGWMGSVPQAVYKASEPSLRIKELMKKALNK